MGNPPRSTRTAPFGPNPRPQLWPVAAQLWPVRSRSKPAQLGPKLGPRLGRERPKLDRGQACVGASARSSSASAQFGSKPGPKMVEILPKWAEANAWSSSAQLGRNHPTCVVVGRCCLAIRSRASRSLQPCSWGGRRRQRLKRLEHLVSPCAGLWAQDFSRDRVLPPDAHPSGRLAPKTELRRAPTHEHPSSGERLVELRPSLSASYRHIGQACEFNGLLLYVGGGAIQVGVVIEQASGLPQATRRRTSERSDKHVRNDAFCGPPCMLVSPRTSRIKLVALARGNLRVQATLVLVSDPPSLGRAGQTSAKFGRSRPNLARIRPNSARIRQTVCGFGRIWCKIGTSLPELDRSRHDFAQIWPELVWSKSAHIGSRWVRLRSKSAQPRPNSVKSANFGPCMARYGQIWPKFDRHRELLPKSGPNLARNLADLAEIWPDLPSKGL